MTTDLDGLSALHDWMRARGVIELTTGGTTMRLGPAPLPASEEPVDVAEPEESKLERKRLRYERLLGRSVSLEEARDHLP